MLSPSNEDRICAMFDSFCKTVSRNFVRNLDRAEGNRDKHFSDEPVDYLHVENEFVCFYTGLYTRRYKAVYGCFDRNKRQASMLDWYFRGLFGRAFTVAQIYKARPCAL